MEFVMATKRRAAKSADAVIIDVLGYEFEIAR
jgi:hypothetical protein